MSDIHYFCPRCGSILTGYLEKPEQCLRCGGVEIVEIGQKGDYNIKHLRKEYHAPYRPDVYFSKPD
ncbi:MAG: hypothetical protein DRO88_06595 [Promethearchaeia archaeon]|nr:MAG: hypothetical protein DRO88_06595 [Candidatus Lokiarchaeia archaeon]